MSGKNDYFIGIDLGGTNIQTALVHTSGYVAARGRAATPQDAGAEDVIKAILAATDEVCHEKDAKAAGVGLAAPGLVEYQHGRLAAAPNVAIAGVNLIEPVHDATGVPVSLVNDCDAATLGERWLGAARTADSAVGIFVGTGIGGGILLDRHLLSNAEYSVAEIGHMCIDRGGPRCGCGNHGCLEAIASRTAIERALRAAMEQGHPTVLHELVGDDPGRIKSKVLAAALEARDEVVTEVLAEAADALGVACSTLRHLFDPRVIVFGGGVMEACGDFLVPRIEAVVRNNPFMAGRPSCQIVLSALGDDAGVLGAAAVAMEAAGVDFLEKNVQSPVKRSTIRFADDGTVYSGDTPRSAGLILRVDGEEKRLVKKGDQDPVASVDDLKVKHVKRACRGGPVRLVVGARDPEAPLPSHTAEYLRVRGIETVILPREQALREHEESSTRDALLLLP